MIVSKTLENLIATRAKEYTTDHPSVHNENILGRLIVDGVVPRHSAFYYSLSHASDSGDEHEIIETMISLANTADEWDALRFMINHMFPWRETDEGYHFWITIDQYLYDEEPEDCYQKFNDADLLEVTLRG